MPAHRVEEVRPEQDAVLRSRSSAWAHLAGSAFLGLGFFALPVRSGDKWTVPVDILVTFLRKEWTTAAAVWTLGLIAAGVLGTLTRKKGFQAGPVLSTLRVTGLLIAIGMVLPVDPLGLHHAELRPLMWNVLALSVALIVPLGASMLNALVSYGLLELLGTLTRPLMRPVFRLPGRAALDDLMSWLGSYSVGLFMTRLLVDDGRYTRREAYIIATGFSTVSVGFVGVVCATLDLLQVFPLVFGTYFIVVYALAALQVRVWPTSGIPDTYVGEGRPEAAVPASQALAVALEKAKTAPPLAQVLWRGWVEGCTLAASIVGTILTVGTLALALAHFTPVADWLGAPLVPVVAALGLPDPELVAPAIVVGITEMYIPALLVKEAALQSRFFIAVLSISQLIFFSSLAPMLLDMFRDLPIRLHELIALFVMRTAVLVPVLAGLTHLYSWLGWL